MPRPKPNKLHDELDALLDGRPVELTDELAPLVEAADALRAELAALSWTPGGRPAPGAGPAGLGHGGPAGPAPAGQRLGPAPPRGRGRPGRRPGPRPGHHGLGRRPARPGHVPLQAGHRAAPHRLGPVVAGPRGRRADPGRRRAPGRGQGPVELKMFTQLPDALTALSKAVVAAQVAVEEAAREGEPVSGVAAKLNQVEFTGGEVVHQVAVAAASGSSPSPTAPATPSRRRGADPGRAAAA